jgi:hypothetical protein
MAQVLHADTVRVPGMTARRLVLAAGEALALRAGGGETMVYVIAGEGAARVPEERGLAAESLVWLAGADRVELEAGAPGLELLVASA